METFYVTKKSEVTATATAFVQAHSGAQEYRTRINCACTIGSPRRHGVLLIQNDTVVCRLIKCRRCAVTEG